jgi:dTDP-4-dehydrorhamnose 3,5-epimerase-like enzyme
MDSFKLLPVKTFRDARGCLNVLENGADLPFEIKRIFYITGVPENTARGGHSCRVNKEIAICLNGALAFTLFDGKERSTVMLTSPEQGLYIPPGLFVENITFSQGAICLVLASITYDEADYVRGMDAYMASL